MGDAKASSEDDMISKIACWNLRCRSSDFTEALPDTRAANHIAGQLLRSGTSPLRVITVKSQSAESRKDFVHKLKVCLKEICERPDDGCGSRVGFRCCPRPARSGRMHKRGRGTHQDFRLPAFAPLKETIRETAAISVRCWAFGVGRSAFSYSSFHLAVSARPGGNNLRLRSADFGSC